MNCVVDGCKNPGRYETEKGLVCAEHYAEPAVTRWNACKVFCATKASDREFLGEKVTAWMRDHPSVTIVDKVVRQSSDDAYHAISIVLFFHA